MFGKTEGEEPSPLADIMEVVADLSGATSSFAKASKAVPARLLQINLPKTEVSWRPLPIS